MNMAKAVVYGFLATAFVLFLVFFPKTNHHHHSHPLRHTCLNRRLGSRCRFGTFTFDPLLSKAERAYYADDHHGHDHDHDQTHHQSSIIVVENNKSDDHHQVIDHDADNNIDHNQKSYRYDGDHEGRLNITLRLIILFPLLDQSPKDGIVTSAELRSWITAQAIERLNYTTHKELASHDINGDGLISFNEYLPQFSNADIGTYQPIHIYI